jgi:hypothetical protein
VLLPALQAAATSLPSLCARTQRPPHRAPPANYPCCRNASASAASDPPDEFFEFTADDFAEVARAAQKRAAAESQLLTRALREQQARSRANAMGPVPVRLHFPDGSIVQASVLISRVMCACRFAVDILRLAVGVAVCVCMLSYVRARACACVRVRARGLEEFCVCLCID